MPLVATYPRLRLKTRHRNDAGQTSPTATSPNSQRASKTAIQQERYEVTTLESTPKELFGQPLVPCQACGEPTNARHQGLAVHVACRPTTGNVTSRDALSTITRSLPAEVIDSDLAEQALFARKWNGSLHDEDSATLIGEVAAAVAREHRTPRRVQRGPQMPVRASERAKNASEASRTPLAQPHHSRSVQ
jgi:hypothetical protein